MSPDNFDYNIKNKLEGRTIKPSEEAWNKLSEKLDTLERKRSNNTAWWLGIAASIVGVLFFVFKSFDDNTERITPIIVDTQEEIKNENVNDELQLKENDEKEELENNRSLVNAKNQSASETKNITNYSEQNAIIPKEEVIQISEVVVAETNNEPKEELQEEVKIEPNTLSFEDQKIQEIVAQIQNLGSDNREVTEEEIDQLLFQAEKQIQQKRLYDQSTKTVDANSLLQGVELELEESFRDKVLEALKSSYENVKVAVINRNE